MERLKTFAERSMAFHLELQLTFDAHLFREDLVSLEEVPLIIVFPYNKEKRSSLFLYADLPHFVASSKEKKKPCRALQYSL